MTRDVLSQILQAADGFEAKDGQFSTREDHLASFYLGEGGRGVTVNEVRQIHLHDGFVALDTAERGVIYTGYDGVHALAVKPTKPNAPRRTGFA